MQLSAFVGVSFKTSTTRLQRKASHKDLGKLFPFVFESLLRWSKRAITHHVVDIKNWRWFNNLPSPSSAFESGSVEFVQLSPVLIQSEFSIRREVGKLTSQTPDLIGYRFTGCRNVECCFWRPQGGFCSTWQARWVVGIILNVPPPAAFF